MPTATAAAEPLLEPPGVHFKFQGLQVGGGSNDANSVVTVLPRTIAPASRSFVTRKASHSAGVVERTRAPADVGNPATSIMSLIAIGMPCNGPRSMPRFNS